jgi:putative membrane protein
MNLTDELARQRNRNALDRTLMAWIRTCLSLISFGFGLDKIIEVLHRSLEAPTAHAGWGVRLVAMAFVLTGIVAMLAATVQYRRDLQRLRQERFVYAPDQRSLAWFTAIAIAAIGVVALVMLGLAMVTG